MHPPHPTRLDHWTTPGVTWASIDPSSTRTGVAIWRPPDAVPLLVALCGGSASDPCVRIDRIVELLADLIHHRRVRGVVIEIPSGRVGTGARAGATGHLAIYGMAVGAIRQACLSMLGGAQDQVISVDERTWTRRRPQRSRIALARAIAPELVHRSDPGGDLADAVALGAWWSDQLPLLAAINMATDSHDAGIVRRRKGARR
ncbi:MAG TPA: hypothetical protein PKC90_13105 [Phycisphaerales bacterium]|nr:hypothetical protein [Phycisphaerales bacterium]